jgi:hypothetical protein
MCHMTQYIHCWAFKFRPYITSLGWSFALYEGKNHTYSNFRTGKNEICTLRLVDFDSVVLCVEAFTIHVNSTQSTQKSSCSF